MKKIIIIGAGQLGSRHLQSLNLIDQLLDITVIDPSLTSLETAQSRFEATINTIQHRINYQQEIDVNDNVDVAIIASTAESRRGIVEKLLNSTKVKHVVLEKLLFTEEKDYFAVEEHLKRQNVRAWVNCTMRMMPYYQQLQRLFINEAIEYHVSGSQYGLVTNAIHYLDHLAFVTGDTEFTLDTSAVDKQIIESKRSGYYELTGTLVARFSQGSIAYLHCNKKGMAPVQIELASHENRIISREWEQKAWQTSLKQDWIWEEVDNPIPFQSTLTAQLVTSLLEKEQCALTDYATSMKIHLQLLNPLKKFLKDNQFKHQMDYPFT